MIALLGKGGVCVCGGGGGGGRGGGRGGGVGGVVVALLFFFFVALCTVCLGLIALSLGIIG